MYLCVPPKKLQSLVFPCSRNCRTVYTHGCAGITTSQAGIPLMHWCWSHGGDVEPWIYDRWYFARPFSVQLLIQFIWFNTLLYEKALSCLILLIFGLNLKADTVWKMYYPYWRWKKYFSQVTFLAFELYTEKTLFILHSSSKLAKKFLMMFFFLLSEMFSLFMLWLRCVYIRITLNLVSQLAIRVSENSGSYYIFARLFLFPDKSSLLSTVLFSKPLSLL